MLEPEKFLELFSRFAVEAEPKTDVSGLKLETRFGDLGIDSVATMELIGMFERELGVLLPESRLMNLRTLGELRTAINRIVEENQLQHGSNSAP